VRYCILPWYIYPSSMLVTTMSTPVEINDSYSSNLMLAVCIWRRDHCAQNWESGIWGLTAEQEMSLCRLLLSVENMQMTCIEWFSAWISMKDKQKREPAS
jgi:hypothetical protein